MRTDWRRWLGGRTDRGGAWSRWFNGLVRGRLGDDGLEVELIARVHVAVPCERQLGGRADSHEDELIARTN